MRPQDIVILLKIISYQSKNWYSKELAKDLFLSPAEVSNSLQRNVECGLLDIDKAKVRSQGFLDFLMFGLPYVYPQRTGALSRGIPTAHSHPFMKKRFEGGHTFVWPDAGGDEKGLSIQPLYPAVVNAVKIDEELYLMLALVEVLRVGNTREKKVAIEELRKLITNEPSS